MQLFAPVLVAPVLLTSLLLPVLQLVRPQLEQRLKTVCVETAAAGNASLVMEVTVLQVLLTSPPPPLCLGFRV